MGAAILTADLATHRGQNCHMVAVAVFLKFPGSLLEIIFVEQASLCQGEMHIG